MLSFVDPSRFRPSMSRDHFLELAAQGHRVPLATDLVLHTHSDPAAIRSSGSRLGRVIAETAQVFRTPLAFPLMDLRLEKAELLRLLGVPAADVDCFHFTAAPTEKQVDTFCRHLQLMPPGPAITAHLEALHYIAHQTNMMPIGMCIGPFSLTTKLLADPIVPVYLSGVGLTAEDDHGVALLDRCRELSLALVVRQIERQIAAGATAVFLAEPAANQIFISPLQMEDGSDVFDRMVLAPNRRIAALLAARGVDLIFHCCGEISEAMLDGFCSLHPTMLSLGSSRRLWEDAARIPSDTVLYGNLPSKLFYSDALMSTLRVSGQAAVLATQMKQCGHPFILGTECDTLFVEEYADTIRAKIDCVIAA